MIFPRVEDAQNIFDLRDMAKRRLPRWLFEFVDRGTEEEVALRNNREAFERIDFEQLLGREQANMSRVAERAGLERTHLYRKLKQLNIRFARRGEDAGNGGAADGTGTDV